MPWQEITFHHIDRSELHQLEALLNLAGALSLNFQADNDEEIFEPQAGITPLWKKTKVSAIFDEHININAITNIAKQCSPQARVSSKWIAEQDWEKSWQQHVKPRQFGDRLWIVPTCHDMIDAQAVNIRLDPGLAFGTGSHPTTQLCLEWLAKNIQTGQSMIDYGCGSGILAIAAYKLGARPVWAVDNDPQAIAATIENSQRNAINNIHTALPTELPAIECDVLIANILAKPIMELFEDFSKLIRNGGTLVLSGLLEEQKDTIIHVYKKFFSVDEITTQQQWLRITLSKLKNSDNFSKKGLE